MRYLGREGVRGGGSRAVEAARRRGKSKRRYGSLEEYLKELRRLEDEPQPLEPDGAKDDEQ